jgi:hypothetical protein
MKVDIIEIAAGEVRLWLETDEPIMLKNRRC